MFNVFTGGGHFSIATGHQVKSLAAREKEAF